MLGRQDHQLLPPLIKENLQFLVENLYPEDKLIDSLWSCCLLSELETKVVKSRSTALEKNECILVILSVKRTRLICDQLKKENYGLMCINGILKCAQQVSYEFQLIDYDDRLWEKVLRCHNEINDKVNSLHVRLFLFERDIISFSDYVTHFVHVEHAEDRRGLCESMMYLLFKDPVKVNSNLQHFMCVLRSRSCYSEIVRHITRDDVGESLDYKANLCCVKNCDMPTGVHGIAVLNGTVYAVLHRESCVYVFEAANIEAYSRVTVVSSEENPNELRWPSDIVADRLHCVLYISDRGLKDGCDSRPGLFTFHPSTERTVFTPLDGETPAGMSMTSDNRLLVACELANNIGRNLRLYVTRQTGGCLQNCLCRVITLDTLSKYLLQPVMLTENLFAISQIHKDSNLYRICLVDDRGQEMARAFGGTKRSAWPSIRSPWGVMKDPINSRRLIVSNGHEHKIILLDHNLNFLMELISQKNCEGFIFLCPRCLCYDDQTNLLYVGRRWKGVNGNHLSATKGAITVFRIVVR